MKLDWLADVLRGEGLDVVEHSGWSTRTMRPFIAYQPVGVIDHHTAGSAVIPNYPDPPFYRNEALEDKCNLTIRPDGVVVCLNAGWAFDSGLGVPAVLKAVREDRPLPPLSLFDSADSTLSGNAWFIDIEVQHLGNGSPIEPVQRDALIRTNAAICRRMGWDPRYRVIGHLEWAPKRKTDPRWDGNANPMPQIRLDTLKALNPGEDLMLALPVTPTSTTETIRALQLMLIEAFGAKVSANGKYDGATATAVKTHLLGFTRADDDDQQTNSEVDRGLYVNAAMSLGLFRRWVGGGGSVDLSGYAKVGHGHKATVSLT